MKNSLFFAGIKHSGKSLYSRLVAKRLGLECFDLDKLILEKTGVESIRSYYVTYGKNSFQKEENDAFVTLKEKTAAPYVLSLGGGAADNTTLLDSIKKEKNNVLIYLWREESLILPRILKDGIPPFLDSNNVEGSFHELYVRRDAIYRERSDLIIDLGKYDDKENKVNMIITSLRENGYVR